MVLYYHHVAAGAHDYTWISPDELRAQLVWARARLEPVTIDEAAAGTEGLAVTFDDGYDDVIAAADVLESLALRGTFFVLPSFVGRRSQFGRAGLEVAHATSADLRELRARGHVIGSHGMTHRDLTTLTDDEIYAELHDSKAALEEMCDERIDYFAYPYGACDSRITQICAGLYRAAWSTGTLKAAAGRSLRHSLSRSYLSKADGGYRCDA